MKLSPFSNLTRLIVMLGWVCVGCTAGAWAQSSDVKTTEIARLAKTFADNNAFSGNVLVADGGSIVYEGQFGEADRNWSISHTPNSKFLIGSMTKSHTAILIMQLVEAGKISLDSVISDYLPSFPAPYKDRITIHQLLTHQSGIPHYPQISGWMEGRFRAPRSDDDFLEIISEMPLNFPPGTDSRYSNTNFFILGKIIETVTEKTYEEILQEKIFSPLGMTSSGTRANEEILPGLSKSYVQDENGNWSESGYLNMDSFVATGSVYSTARDLFKLDQALYGNELLSAESKARLFDKNEPYGWDVYDTPLCNGAMTKNVISYNGGLEGFLSLIVRFPEEQRTIILLNNSGTEFNDLVGLADQIADDLYCKS